MANFQVYTDPIPGTRGFKTPSGTFYLDETIRDDEALQVLQNHLYPPAASKGLLQSWGDKISSAWNTPTIQPTLGEGQGGLAEAAGKIVGFWKAPVDVAMKGLSLANALTTGPQQYLGEKAGRALGITDPKQLEMFPPGWRPIAEKLTPETLGTIGEFVGSLADPLALWMGGSALARKAGKAVEKFDAARVFTVPETPLVPKPRSSDVTSLLDAVEAHRTPIPQVASNDLTLDAAMKHSIGQKPLDLGTVGKERMLRRMEPEVPSELTQAPTPLSPPPGSAAELVSQAPLRTPAEEYGLLSKALNQTYRDPLRVAEISKDPALKGMVGESFKMQEVEDTAFRVLNDTIKNLTGQVSKAEIPKVLKLLDTEGGANYLDDLSPTGAEAYSGLRNYFNQIADAHGLPSDARISDYFPRYRDFATVVEKRIAMKPESEAYWSRYFSNALPGETRLPFYLKPRTDPEVPASEYSLDMLRHHARAVAGHLARSGGKMPFTTEAIEGFTPALQRLGTFENLQPRNIEYGTKFFNDMTGVTKPVEGWLPKSWMQNLLMAEYGSKIGLNPAAPIQNLSQQLWNLAELKPSSIIKGYGDYGKHIANTLLGRESDLAPELLARGATGKLGKMDVVSDEVVGWFDRFTHAGTRPFKASEQVNQGVFVAQGLEEAATRGLTGEAADALVREGLHRTQQFGSPATLPPAWRNAPPEVRVLLQFKNYPREFANFIGHTVQKDWQEAFTIKQRAGEAAERLQTALAKNDPSTFAFELLDTIDLLPFARTAKLVTATLALGGTDALTAGNDKAVSEFLTGLVMQEPSRELLTVKGILPQVGIYLGTMIGLGQLPVADAGKLVQYFTSVPGLNTIGDGIKLGATAGFAAAGQPRDFFAPGALENLVMRGDLPPVGPVEWGRVATSAIRDLPVLSIANKGLQVARDLQTPADVPYLYRPSSIQDLFTAPRENLQAIGLRAKPHEFLGLWGQPAYSATGLQSTTQADWLENLRTSYRDQRTQRAAVQNLYEQAVNAGELTEEIVNRFIDLGVRPNRETLRRVYKNRLMGPEMARMQQLPKNQRPRWMQLLEELETGEEE